MYFFYGDKEESEGQHPQVEEKKKNKLIDLVSNIPFF